MATQQQAPQGSLRVVQSTDFQPPPSRSIQQHRQQTKRPAAQPQLFSPSLKSAVPDAPAPAPASFRQELPVQQPVQQPVRQQALQMDAVGAMLQQMASQLDILTRTVVSMDERLSSIEKEGQKKKHGGTK